MTSTKEIFASGLNYILRDIKDTKEMLESGTEYLNKIQAKQKTKPQQVYKIQVELRKIKKQLKEHENEFKYYVDYYGYTQEDLVKYNVHASTDEEIEEDEKQDLLERGYDEQRGRGKYTLYDHTCLVQRVNEYNKLHDLPTVNF